jgi:hyperosmotically inducible periplasmic protein
MTLPRSRRAAARDRAISGLIFTNSSGMPLAFSSGVIARRFLVGHERGRREVFMKRVLALLTVVVFSSLGTAALAQADPNDNDRSALGVVDRANYTIFKDVANQVNRYPNFTVFDDVAANIDNGMVTLTGHVTMPYKKDDLERRVMKVNGVVAVQNKIEVLPVSMFDDELRFRIARAIYGNSSFWQYAAMANPPIHIVVKNGNVTLEGVVNSNVERALARSLATGFGEFSVKNNLKTDAEMTQVLEQIK